MIEQNIKNTAHLPFISVIMPAYNASSYIVSAIESILSQTFYNFEFIIVNDGSTDSTEEKVLSFKDKRIRYVKNESNSGIINCLNTALSMAAGKYIARMDADDISLPERFQMQVSYLESHPETIICGTDYFLLRKNSLHHSRSYANGDYLRATLIFATCFAHPTIMMRNVFNDPSLKYNSEFPHAEDYKLWTDLALLGKFHVIEKPLLKYRDHQQQVSVKNRESQHLISTRIRKEYLLKTGFDLQFIDLNAIDKIGNNTRISSEQELTDAEKCLCELQKQNQKSKFFTENDFKVFVYKFWLDTCGNTSLGLLAYKKFFRSELAELCPVSTYEKIKLFGKCLIRRSK